MKNKLFYIVIAVLVLVMTSCATSVNRVATGTARELSGFWNERDVDIVCTSLLDDMFYSARYKEYTQSIEGRPLIRVGSFRNESDEHIDTSIVTSSMQNAIFNSGLADFVADRSFLDDLHAEQDYGLDYANPDESASIGNESAPDLLLQGTVRTIVQKSGRHEVRTYYVNAQLTDVETGRLVWSGENSEISKEVTEASVRW